MVAGTYNGPKHIANAFVELGLSPESRILDVLAGSGLVAELVYIVFNSIVAYI